MCVCVCARIRGGIPDAFTSARGLHFTKLDNSSLINANFRRKQDNLALPRKALLRESYIPGVRREGVSKTRLRDVVTSARGGVQVEWIMRLEWANYFCRARYNFAV